MGLCGIRNIVNFLFMRSVEGAVIVLILLFLPNIPPHCKIEKPFKVTKTLPLEGKLAINDKLNNVEILFNGTIQGPEQFIGIRGMLFTGTVDGTITRIHDKQTSVYRKLGTKCEHFEPAKCGRPLGLHFDSQDNLIVADAHLGIFRVEPQQSHLIVSPKVEIAGKTPQLFNSVVVAKNGDIYWVASSTEFSLEDGLFTMFADPTGILVKYDAKTKKNTILMDNVHFANGLVLTKNEDALILAETGRSSLHKYDLKTGKSTILIEGLPGMPDNLRNDGHGGLLVPLITSHDENHPNLLQILGPFPWIRKLIARALGLAQLTFKGIDYVVENDYSKMAVHYIGHLGVGQYLPKPKRTSILHISENGEILNSWHSTNGNVNFISEAYIFNEHLYLGSPWNNYIARIHVKELGLKPQERQQVKPKPVSHKSNEAPKSKELPEKAKEAAKKVQDIPVKTQEANKPQETKKAAPVLKNKPQEVKSKENVKKSEEKVKIAPKNVEKSTESKKTAPHVDSKPAAAKEAKAPEVKTTKAPIKSQQEQKSEQETRKNSKEVKNTQREQKPAPETHKPQKETQNAKSKNSEKPSEEKKPTGNVKLNNNIPTEKNIPPKKLGENAKTTSQGNKK